MARRDVGGTKMVKLLDGMVPGNGTATRLRPIIAVVPQGSERCRNRNAEASLFIARRSA